MFLIAWHITAEIPELLPALQKLSTKYLQVSHPTEAMTLFIKTTVNILHHVKVQTNKPATDCDSVFLQY